MNILLAYLLKQLQLLMPKTPPKGLGVTLYKNSPAIILIVDCLVS